MQKNINFPVKYAECLYTKERHDLIKEEAKDIQDKYHITDVVKVCIIKHYLYNHHAKLGNVSKTVKFVNSILIYCGYNEEERTKFLTENFRMYLADFNDFRIRLGILNRCNLFEEAFFVKSRFLSKYSSSEAMSYSELYSVCAKKSFDITFKELEHIETINYNKQELMKKYPLTKEEIDKMDKELVKKIKSFADIPSNGSTKTLRKK